MLYANPQTFCQILYRFCMYPHVVEKLPQIWINESLDSYGLVRWAGPGPNSKSLSSCSFWRQSRARSIQMMAAEVMQMGRAHSQENKVWPRAVGLNLIPPDPPSCIRKKKDISIGRSPPIRSVSLSGFLQSICYLFLFHHFSVY